PRPGKAARPPRVGPVARLIWRKVIPSRSVRAVVLAHRPPLALAQIRFPEFPALVAARVFGEPHPLGWSGLALGRRLDHIHDGALILAQHGAPPMTASPATDGLMLRSFEGSCSTRYNP